MQSRPGLKKFLDHCCQERLYSFSIKKCGSTTCSICNPPRLAAEVFSTLHHLPDPVPDITGEHYRNFEDLYGTPTLEEYRPSMTEGGRKPHGLPFQPNTQYARNVGMTMQCCEYLKPRVIYAQLKLRIQDGLCFGARLRRTVLVNVLNRKELVRSLPWQSSQHTLSTTQPTWANSML